MSIRKSLGTFFNRPGFYGSGEIRSRIAAYREPHVHGKFGHEPLGLYKRTLGPPAPFQPLPTYPGYADIYATITSQSLPFEDLNAYIAAWHVGNTTDLKSYILPTTINDGDIRGVIIGYKSTSTQLHEYSTITTSFFGGFSVFTRLLTRTPDLYASVHGFDYKALLAYVNVSQLNTSDLTALVVAAGLSVSDLSALLSPVHIDDFEASLNVVDPVNLTALLNSIPPESLPASVTPVPPSDLLASAGGHPPSDLSGYLLVNLPSDLLTYIRAGDSSTSSLTAALTISSSYSSFPGLIMVYGSSTSDLSGQIKPWSMSRLTANIRGWGASSLTANVYALYSRDITTRIFGYAEEVTANLPAIIRPTRQSTLNLAASVSGWISAHTSDRPISYGKLPRSASTLLLSAFGGFSVFWPDTVYGYTPDLHASINVIPRSRSDLGGYIVPTIRSTSDLSAVINSKTKLLVRNMLSLRFVNAARLTAYVGISSGYRTLSSYVRGVAEGSTETAANAYWSERTYRLSPILSSNRGILLLRQLSRTYTKYTFVNNSNTPDLWAVIYGWDTKSLSASINVVPIATLIASLNVVTLDRLANITASIHSFDTDDISGLITAGGGFSTLQAYVNSSGQSSSITASIYPYFAVSGVMSIPVSTIPFSDLRATVNYSAGDYVFGSGFSALTSFVNCFSQSNANITAQISATTDTTTMPASLTGLKSTRLRVLNILFRSRTRSFLNINSVVFGVGSILSDLAATIIPVHYSTDLSASITVKRYPFGVIQKLSPISVYEIVKNNATLLKELELKFGSAVPYYIYDSLSSSVFSFGDQRWTIRMSSTTTADDFFDKSTESLIDIDDISTYNSVDEAIRAAINRMSLGYYVELAAAISCAGGYYPLTSSIYATQPDRESYLAAEIVGTN